MRLVGTRLYAGPLAREQHLCRGARLFKGFGLVRIHRGVSACVLCEIGTFCSVSALRLALLDLARGLEGGGSVLVLVVCGSDALLC
jgi:hypothetical protein